MASTISIRKQQVSTQIGITAEERRLPQVIEVTTTITPRVAFQDLGDDIAETVDYFVVYQRILEVCVEKERHLLETLAKDLAVMVQAEFAIAGVKVEIDKFILPNVDCVRVSYEI